MYKQKYNALRVEVIESIKNLVLRFGKPSNTTNNVALNIPVEHSILYLEVTENNLITRGLKTVSFDELSLSVLADLVDVLFKVHYRYHVDPDSGWQYGFPKQLPKGFDVNNHDEVIKFIKDNGFPHEVITYRIF